ncbi:MAG TPA: DUF2752 domain-containing protein [Pyrinomonadaceae bacterium]|nr:DUF2752 domain-containing protein [Pyrinomonadaceae bacterium]
MQAEQQITSFKLPPLVERLTAGAGAAVMAAGSAAVFYFDPSKHQFFPVCPLYAMLGIACPGCGLTRGFHSLFHGDVISAVDFNVLVPLWAVILGWVWVSLMLLAIRGKGLPMWPTNPRFMSVFFIALVVFGVLRNIPVWPLTILFP